MDYPSKEILRARKRENEPLPEPYYGTEPDGEMFFYVGNTRIKVSEHFNDKGKSVEDLLSLSKKPSECLAFSNKYGIIKRAVMKC